VPQPAVKVEKYWNESSFNRTEEMKKLDKKYIKDILALTPTQEGILYHYLKEPGSNYYVVQLSLDISGEIDFKTFVSAWNFVIESNDMLRTVFRWEKVEKPGQVILKNHYLVPAYHDLSGKGAHEMQTAAEELKAGDRDAVLDLEEVPFRITLCKIDCRTYEMIITHHHILYDGWSTGIILKEFLNAYTDLCSGKQLIKPGKNQFKEFVKWTQDLEEKNAEVFWKEYLAGLDTIPGIPIKRKSGTPQTNVVMAAEHVRFSRAGREKITDFAAAYKITLAALIYSAWGILLQKYNNTDDVIFGTTVSGRPVKIKSIEEMVGLFINTLPFRVQTHPGENILDLLVRTAGTLKIREAHESTPLVRINEYLNRQTREALFDSIVVIENYPLDKRLKQSYGPLSINSYSTVETPHYDLTLGITLADEIDIECIYHKDGFDKENITRMIGHFKSILLDMADDPGKRILDIEIISPEEKNKILYEFNHTGAGFPEYKTVRELFAEQVDRTPAGIAVIFKEQNISYKELNEKSNQLAYLLREKGVKPDTIAGIMVERSLEMIIGILGILKAGGAYLPIDPDYPRERVQYMLSDSNTWVLLTNKGSKRKSEIRISKHETNSKDQNSNDQNEVSPCIVLNFEHLNFGFVSDFEIRASNLDFGKAEPSNLAYVIYTSGSTGKPKGVMVEHRNLTAYLQAFAREFAVGPGDIIVQQASFSFDAFAEEVYPILLNGGRIAIPVKAEVMDAARLSGFLLKHGVNIIDCSPLLLNELNQLETANLDNIHTFISGGDVLKGRYIDNLLKKGKVYNTYGPTETTVCAAYYRCPGDSGLSTHIPIGKPVLNYRLYIVDRNIKPQPVGIPGELCISGPGVARGYMNQPELTGERYYYRTYISKKIYKTGDLACWLPDGNIEFLGRIDQQVKIRGFRIELGEIENRLLKHGLIKEVVVIDRDEGNEEKYLCAYIVSGETPDPGELKEFLARTLPQHMIPSFFVQIEKIPLTPGGKVDRTSLPSPAHTVKGKYTAPRGEIETKLVEIWSVVLGIEQPLIGIDDNFFELGGHSLKAGRLVSRIHKELDIMVSIPGLFKLPTIRGLAENINNAQKRVYSRIELTEEKEYYRVSSAQKRLYILQQMEKNNISYNMIQSLVLEGELDRERLEKVFRRLIERHESFRTCFEMVNGEPVQRIQEGDCKFQVPGEIENFVQPFDLSKAPLLRVGLFKLGSRKHMLMVDMHHIVSDGVSTGILINDFTAIYAGEELPVIGMHYRDFSEWQNRRQWKEAIKYQETYWLKQFEGDVPVLDLPTDFPRPFVQQFEGRTLFFQVGSRETAALEEIAARQQATLYMILLSIFTIFLARISNREDMVIGTPAAARNRADLESIIGMFVNTLALRNYPGGENTFFTFLDSVKKHTLEAFENQEYPFEELVEKVSVNRDSGRNPLFDVMFALQDLDIPVMAIPGLTLTPLDYAAETAKFDLTFICEKEKSGENLHFAVEYSTKLFKENTIQRFIRYFKRVVSHVVRAPGTRITEIELMSEKEKNEILYDFNDTQTDYPADKTIRQLFAEQAFRRPDNAATAGVGQIVGAQHAVPFPRDHISMTYGELNKKSDRLAHLLREKGVGPDSIVAIMVERCLEMIIGILGILKAGGAYLPIETDYPQERVEYMLKDSGARVLLKCNNNGLDKSEIRISKSETNPNDRNRIAPCIVLNFEHLNFEFLNGCPSLGLSNFEIRASNFSPSNLAYIIYTSGTTGRAKGVLTMHTNVVRVVRNTNYIEIKKSDRVLQLSNYAFDGSVFDIYGALLNGAALVLLAGEKLVAVDRLAASIKREQVTVFFVTTALFNTLVDFQLDCFRDIRSVLFGGERISVEHSRKALEYMGKGRIIHVYGPTETTVYATYYFIDTIADNAVTIPIGKPISNTEVYLFDKNLNPVPVGVSGEVYISGKGTARGYLNRPELTAEKFDHDLWDYQDSHDENQKLLRGVQGGSFLEKSPPGRRRQKLYKTGDLARWLPDGNIEFIGRLDRQVKLRGFRIELGEIESRLVNHDEINEAVVVLKEDKQETRGYLCAHYVSSGAVSLAAAELREYLSKRLPHYMIPSYFVQIDEIPLTSNGKVDRRRLPEPVVVSAARYGAPGNEIEEKLVKIWAEVLNIDRTLIGVNDNFFELGGHSLKATTMVQHVYKEFAVKIEIEDVFTHPFIGEMAQRLKGLGVAVYAEPGPTPVEKRDYYPLSHAQRRLWVLCQLEKDSTAYNMPAVFSISGSFKIEVFTRAVQALVDRHESLRTLFAQKDGEPVQKIIENFVFDLEQVAFDSLDENTKQQKAREIYLEDANRAFDLEHGPLFRFKLIRLENKEHILVYNIHHIVNDGWSQGILFTELSTLYNTFLRGEENPLYQVAFRYKDYTLWHNRLVETDSFKQSRAYWLEKFKDKPNGIELPLDHPRQAIQTFNGGEVIFIIDSGKTTRLHRLSFEQDVTLFMSLLTLLSIFLYRYSGQTDIIIAAPIANRKRPELHPIVGFFVNTLVYRSEINPRQSSREQLKIIKKEAVDCYRNQDYPFDILVDQLEPDRDLSQSPLFNVMLAYNNTETRDLKMTWEGVTISDYTHGNEFNMSKFDLTFFMDEMAHQVYIRLEYNSDLFERPTIERMSRNFMTLVDHIIDIDGMEIPISALNIISSDECRQILYEFNGERHVFPPLTLQQMFANQAGKSGDKIVVVYNGEHITYQVLNRESNGLAHYLREEYGIRPNDIVGVSLERSIDMIITLLGIIKSGAAYLALDPLYPKNRIWYMLRDSQANVLILDNEEPQLSRDYKGIVMDMPFVRKNIDMKSFQDPAIVNKAPDILYVTYTSGSTGTPNGAVVSHDIFTNLIRWQKENTSIDGSLHCLQFASINFDVSFQEIMGTLTAGGQLHLIGEMERKDIDYLIDFLRIRCLEVLYLPFYYLNVLFTGDDWWNRYSGHSLKHIITAGEQLIITPGLKSFLDLNPGVQLHNHYGPAEMHVVTSYTMDAPTAGKTRLPPIGKPVSNVCIYILDADRRPVPIGVWGELHVVGTSAFVGYLNKPDLTDKKLLTTGVCLEGKRLYRTGDIGRWLPDGNIELRGRKDFQVKVRGFRVEPGEIESKLLAIAGVKECVVVVRQNETKQTYLAAYMVVDGIKPAEIRQHIGSELPQFMIPQFVVLDSLPLLPNGKVDRNKLPEPQPNLEEEYTPPENQVEEKLVHIWSEVLGIEREKISVQSDFFQLGGHSLKAVALVSKIHKELDSKVELTEIFKNPTIRGISSLIKAIQWANNQQANPGDEIEEMIL
jgi:amino acid adenylation domain-containing protein